MGVETVDHIGIVFEDLEAATSFFLDLGFEVDGQAEMNERWIDRVIGIEGTHTEFVMMKAPDASSKLELIKFHNPNALPDDPNASSNTIGLRHICIRVSDLDAALSTLNDNHETALIGGIENYQNVYKLCYVRGPEGIIVELAERICS